MNSAGRTARRAEKYSGNISDGIDPPPPESHKLDGIKVTKVIIAVHFKPRGRVMGIVCQIGLDNQARALLMEQGLIMPKGVMYVCKSFLKSLKILRMV